MHGREIGDSSPLFFKIKALVPAEGYMSTCLVPIYTKGRIPFYRGIQGMAVQNKLENVTPRQPTLSTNVTPFTLQVLPIRLVPFLVLLSMLFYLHLLSSQGRTV